MANLTPQQRDLLIRTIIGESAHEPMQGQLGVAYTILNRLNSGRYGSSLEDVIFAKSQFEPWATRRVELLKIPQTSDVYQAASIAADAALGGSMEDPTGGATHFYAPRVMEGRGGEPFWAQNMRANGTARQLGNQIFGQADMPADGSASVPSENTVQGPGGLLDADTDTEHPSFPAEPDWEALKSMGEKVLKKAKDDKEQEKYPMPQAQVFQPLRRITLGKGLLG